jgi:uncharacterized protein DUF2017
VAGFRRGRHGTTAKFSADEAAVLRDLFGQLVGMLEESAPRSDLANPDPLAELTGMTDTSSTERSADPVLARLFPDAYNDDPTMSGEFRRYTESDLRAGKLAAANTVLDSLADLTAGGTLHLDAATSDQWLTALNDLRLTLGTRLEVTEDSYDELAADIDAAPDEPSTVALALFVWLGYLQETLVEAVG